MNTPLKRNPYLLFSPLLCYYIYYIIKHKWPVFYGDETRYIAFATNLTHGFFSPPAPHINLWNGPGYPLLLAPLVALHLPAIALPLINALLYYLSVVFLYKALSLIVNSNIALLFALIWGIYFNMFPLLPAVLTEVFTGFLVSSILYSLTLLYSKKKTAMVIVPGLLLGLLALTKIIFGYVLLICLLVCLVLLLVNKVKIFYKASVYTLLIAFAVTMPYLAYTYSLTGKIFYWGNAGGMSLYWMSSPYDLEYGDWKMPNLTNGQFPIPYASAEGDSILRHNHASELNFILKHDGVEQDELFKQAAISNIKKYPKKFARNYFYNFSRLFFDYPYSYTYQNTQVISNIITGSLILWASVIVAVLSLLNWRKIIYPVKFSLLIVLVYLLLNGALSAYARQLDVVVPVLLFWIAFVVANLPKIKTKFKE